MEQQPKPLCVVYFDKAVEEIMPSHHINTRTGRSTLNANNVSGHYPDPPVPKGCKKYFFQKDGTFRNELGDGSFYWDTIASSDRRAKEKFSRHESTKA